jgi:hypothetical protein
MVERIFVNTSGDTPSFGTAENSKLKGAAGNLRVASWEWLGERVISVTVGDVEKRINKGSLIDYINKERPDAKIKKGWWCFGWGKTPEAEDQRIIELFEKIIEGKKPSALTLFLMKHQINEVALEDSSQTTSILKKALDEENFDVIQSLLKIEKFKSIKCLKQEDEQYKEILFILLNRLKGGGQASLQRIIKLYLQQGDVVTKHDHTTTWHTYTLNPSFAILFKKLQESHDEAETAVIQELLQILIEYKSFNERSYIIFEESSGLEPLAFLAENMNSQKGQAIFFLALEKLGIHKQDVHEPLLHMMVTRIKYSANPQMVHDVFVKLLESNQANVKVKNQAAKTLGNQLLWDIRALQIKKNNKPERATRIKYLKQMFTSILTHKSVDKEELQALLLFAEDQNELKDEKDQLAALLSPS